MKITNKLRFTVALSIIAVMLISLFSITFTTIKANSTQESIYYSYQVKVGDSVQSIARKLDSSNKTYSEVEDAIIKLNGLNRDDKLGVGEILDVPVF